jgi:hypothetical protein
MSTFQWFELGAGILFVALIVFAFWQGLKVKPHDPEDRPPPNRNIFPGSDG